MMKPVCAVILAFFAILSISCGGGSGGGGNSNNVYPTLTVDWPALSRDVAAPASALSLQITLSGVNGGNPFTFNRAYNPAAHVETYTLPSGVSAGIYSVNVQFNSLEDASGLTVGVANGTAQVSTSAISLGNFTMVGTVASVQVLMPPVMGNYTISGTGVNAYYTTTAADPTTPQTIPLGSTVELTAAAFDSSGDDLVVAPSGIFWSAVGSPTALSITTDGHATGLAVGSAQVQVQIDGVTSPATTVNVANPTAVAGCTNATYEPNYAQEIENATLNNTDSTIQSTYGSLGGSSLMHWTSLPVTVQVSPNSYATAHFLSLLQTALTTWTNATGGRVIFTTVTNSSSPDITVTFQPSASIDGTDDGTVGLTTATPSASDPTIISTVQIQIASDLDNDYQELNVLCHELGHGLGIEGHSGTNQDLMFPYLNDAYAPTTDDVNTLLTAYCGSFPVSSNVKRPKPGRKQIIIHN